MWEPLKYNYWEYSRNIGKCHGRFSENCIFFTRGSSSVNKKFVENRTTGKITKAMNCPICEGRFMENKWKNKYKN